MSGVINATLAETTNINVSFGQLISTGGLATFIRRSDYVHGTLTAYTGYAPEGSSEASAVWVITVIITTASGDVTSSVQTADAKWSERYSL